MAKINRLLIFKIAGFVGQNECESSEMIRARVHKARKLQRQRFLENNINIFNNAMMGLREIDKLCKLDNEAKNVLNMAVKKFSFSARVYDKIKKVARTIADLNNSKNIEVPHIYEALQYRCIN